MNWWWLFHDMWVQNPSNPIGYILHLQKLLIFIPSSCRKIQLPIFSPLYLIDVTLTDICKSAYFVFLPVVPSSQFRNMQISTPSLLWGCRGGINPGWKWWQTGWKIDIWCSQWEVSGRTWLSFWVFEGEWYIVFCCSQWVPYDIPKSTSVLIPSLLSKVQPSYI
jgi:hypothetical protein